MRFSKEHVHVKGNVFGVDKIFIISFLHNANVVKCNTGGLNLNRFLAALVQTINISDQESIAFMTSSLRGSFNASLLLPALRSLV